MAKKAEDNGVAKKIIVIKCKGAGVVDIAELHEFQSDLKELSMLNAAKLRGEILTLGFSDPFSVWIDSKKTKYVLNGHQRRTVLLKMREEGYVIPKLPFTIIEADDWRQAKLKVLALTSQYGTITPAGLDAFMKEVGIKLEEVDERFEFGPEAKQEMQLWLKCQGDPPGAWKTQMPAETPLSKKEMAIPYDKWLRGFRKLYVLFSGGKDSMAMVSTLLDYKIPKKKMLLTFMRTPLDHPGTEESVIEFGKLVGIETCLIGKKYSRTDYVAMFEKIGFPTPQLPWCTATWKVSHWRNYVRDNKLAKDDTICVCIGWRKQESERRSKASTRCMGNHQIRLARPILEMKEDKVFAVIEKRGWPLHYCYEHSGKKEGYTDRLGCFYCYAYKRPQWVHMREKRPDLWIKALEVLALGCASPNISDQMVRDCLRMLFGFDTVYQARKKHGLPFAVKAGGRWKEPAHDPVEDSLMPDEKITREDFGEAKHLTNE